MASSKRIGFFWGEDKITLVEFDKNAPLRAVSSPLGPQTGISSPFSPSLTEEIQITAIFQKMLQDNQIMGGPFYVSLPMKEIILRSFVIPFVEQEDIQNTVKFEAKKYLPIDIEDLTFIFYTVPFTEDKIRRLQVIFFAVRKESLLRYGRIFKQINVEIFYAEPCMVSLAKVLLFKKEITPAGHFAFLILDGNSGRICFINRGIPQFVREFSIGPNAPSQEIKDPMETLNLKIVNEVVNSFDFYERQLSGERIEQLLVSAEAIGEGLFNALEGELKLKLRKVSPVVTMGEVGQGNDMDTIYAMGACVEPPIRPLSGFNFLGDNTPKFEFNADLIESLKLYKASIFVFLICVVSLVGVHIFFQGQLKILRQQYAQLSSKQGAFSNTPIETMQAESQQNTDKLAAYKSIRTKSDVALIVLRVASHLPQGALLKTLSVKYDEVDSNHVTIEMNGNVVGEDPNGQIAVVNQIFSGFKNDKGLSRFIKTVSLVSLNRGTIGGKQVTTFNIHCS